MSPSTASTVNGETGFALPSPRAQVSEKKMIPVLDIKVIESLDNLTFSIVLHDECQMNSYDVADTTKPMRTSSLMNAFGNMLNNATSQSQADGGFPMAFESEHVPDILQGFQKI